MLPIKTLFRLKVLLVFVVLLAVTVTMSSCRHDDTSSGYVPPPNTMPVYDSPYTYSSAVFDSVQEVYKLATVTANELINYIEAPNQTEVNCFTSGSKSLSYTDTDSSGSLNSGDTLTISYTSCRNDDFNGIANGSLALILNSVSISDINGKTGLVTKVDVTVTDFTLQEIDRDISIANNVFSVSVDYDPSVGANLAVSSDQISVKIGTGLEILNNLLITQTSNYTNGIIELDVNGNVQSTNNNAQYSFTTVIKLSQYYLAQNPHDGYLDVKRNDGSTIRFSAPDSSSYLNSMQYYSDENGDGVFESGPFGLSDWISTPNNLFMLFRGENVSPSTIPPNTNTTPVLFYITSTSPSPNTTGVGFNTPVIVTFNNDIDVKSVMPYNISISTGTATQTNFPNTSFDITTQGNSISINLNRIMEHNTSYTVSMSPSIRDTSGNSLSYSDTLLRFSFTVKPYNNKIDIGQALTRMIYDDVNNVIYGIDKVNKKLLSIDVATNSVLSIYNLTYRPDDLCIDSINNRIFIVNNGSSFISEFDLLQAKITNNIPFSALIDSNTYGEPRYRIACLPNKLILTDAGFQPGLWSVDLTIANPVAVSLTTTVRGVGDFIVSPDGTSLYYWAQNSWSSPSWGGLKRINLTDFTLTDSTKINSYESFPSNRDIYAPVFINTNSTQIINHRYIFNANNLGQIYYTFPVDETIYAADFTNNRIASRSSIYELTNYNPIAFTPTKKATQMLFVNSGLLYMMVNEQSALYYMDPSIAGNVQ